MLKIIDKQNRGKLMEGRNYQMGFAFCKKVSNKVFETIQPISPCKDYLNDVVYSERTGNPVSAYGLSTKKIDLFTRKRKAYLAIKIMDYYGYNGFNKLAQHTENLKNNYANLNKFLNYFEEKLGMSKTQVAPADNDSFVLILPIGWTKYNYAISLYSLLARVGQFYDGTTDPITFMETYKDFPEDSYLVKSIVPKVKKLLDIGKLPEQNLNDLGSGTNVHNAGIAAFNL